LRIADETEITQSQRPVPPGAPPPPDAPPPRFLLADAWPWLALLGIVVVGGLLVWLFVIHNRGHKGKVVPAVVGLQQQQAVAKLTGDGINVKVIIGPSARPQGIVASQVPGGGSRIAKDQVVTLHVSNGHALQTTTAATTTTTQATTKTTTQSSLGVPNVTGQDMASAAGQIEAAGFVAETDPGSSSGSAGSVLSQDPAAGAQAPAGSIVRLEVAVGTSRPAVRVPNVVGQKAAAARAALLDAKLTAKTIYKKGPATSIGVVLSESPTGSQPAYSQLTLTVGS
jgi:beta-lactam-binding protein with PASTA domain